MSNKFAIGDKLIVALNAEIVGARYDANNSEAEYVLLITDGNRVTLRK